MAILGADERERFERRRESFSAACRAEYAAADYGGKWRMLHPADDALLFGYGTTAAHQARAKQEGYMIERFADRASAYLINDANRRESQKFVEIYRSMMRLLFDGDVSENAEFHRLYNVFYKLRFSGGNGRSSREIYAAYYRLIETHKRAAAKPAIEQVLEELWSLTGQIHLSFGSKLIGTLYPESAPIWDNNVRILLDIPYKVRPGDDHLALAAKAYHELEARYHAFLPAGGMPTERAARVIAVFDDAFPDAKGIAAWKKIDFLLWRMGSRKSRQTV